MSSVYFGFEEEPAVEVIEERTVNTPSRATQNKPPSPAKLSISQIQKMLTEDIKDDSVLLENSFYSDDLPTPEKPSRKRGSPRSTQKRKAKVLGSIENVIAETPSPKKRPRKTKNGDDENQVPKTQKNLRKSVLNKSLNKSRTKKKNSKEDEQNDEKYEKLLEEMNKTFEEIENFQLLVE